MNWYLISELETLNNLAGYQKMFLSFLLANPDNYYSGMGEFEGEELIDYVDSHGGKLWNRK